MASTTCHVTVVKRRAIAVGRVGFDSQLVNVPHMPGTIKFVGGVALMVSGLTGPSIAVIPQLFQEAGWFT